ncbi:DUF2617 family protein [Nocardiopsis trehalosi]|uniref:DUF2617 family protein n=1 Tax=Nocardiopsis trehalosi TaxID=109329 RepID=UPI00082B7AB5|nr:DUF2617 family protein [Nocardiopsis trehalosi]
MRQTIAGPFADTRAADLVWSLDHPPIAPLASRVVRAGAGRVELRVLGASHQILVDLPDHALTETVACLPGADPGLPGHTAAPVGGRHYDFASRVERPGPDHFASRVDDIVRAVDGHPGGLLAEFPGAPYAVTALIATAAARTVHWRTWHAYPQTGELVVTTGSSAPSTAPPTPERKSAGHVL